MHSAWFKNCRTEEERVARRKQLQSFTTAFKELEAVLVDQFSKKPSVRDYGEPGWAERQIAANEYNQSLSDLLKLIDTKDN